MKVRQNIPSTVLLQTQRFRGVWESQISGQSACEIGKVVSHTHQPPLPPGNISGTQFSWSLIRSQVFVGPELLCKKNSNESIGNRTCVLPACRAMPHPTAPPNTGRKKIIFCKNLFYQRCRLCDVLQCNTNRYDNYGKAMFNTQAACWYRLLTVDQSTGSDPSICFAVTSQLLPSKEYKINNRTWNVEK